MAEEITVAHEPERLCSICRSDRFVWGVIENPERTLPKPLTFSADGQSFKGRLTGEGSGTVRTRMCVNCRHLDEFAVDGSFPLG